MTMPVVDGLPYDVLRMVFDSLDKQTLFNACLAGRALNEACSWSLYTSVTFNPDGLDGNWYRSETDYFNRRNPIWALKRRPQLRNAVRNVTLCGFRTTRGYEYQDENVNRSLEYCHQALALLPNVTYLHIRYCSLQIEWDFLSKWIPQLHCLRTLEFLGIGDRVQDLPDSNVKHIHAELCETIVYLAKSSMAHKLRALTSGYYFYDMTPTELSQCLRSFSGLTRFSAKWDVRLTPSELCELIAAAPSLREVLIRCGLETESATIFPTGAKNLTYLRIQFTPERYGKEAVELKSLVQCVAGACQLRRLDLISTARRKPVFLSGDSLVNGILPQHGRTLEKLKLPHFHISSVTLRELLSQCDRLTTLWLGVTPELKAVLPELLAKSTSLEILRIFVEGTWNFMYAQAILRQTCRTLREFKVCAKHVGVTTKASWKVHWEYDKLMDKAVFQVCGPVSVALENAARIRYKRSCTTVTEDDEESAVRLLR